MPVAVPAGLEHDRERWHLAPNDKDCFQPFAFTLTDEQATLMCVGRWVLLIAACGWVLDYDVDGWNVFGWGTDAEKSQCGGRQSTPTAALAAALHKLADEEGAEA